MIYLAGDNFAPAHPSIMEAVMDANRGHSPAYGLDPWTERAEKAILKAFEREGEVYFIPTGTGGNVFALKLACQRHESVICTDVAHLNYQESGAAEAIVGCKLLTVEHHNGKASPTTIRHRIKKEKAFGRHSTLPRVLSITQPTEYGTLYAPSEMEALVQLCQEENLLLHVDGSRLYNAAVQLDTSFHHLSKRVDLLSLGGTKNGLMGAEALIIFNPTLQPAAAWQQKQNLLLLSKMRYLSAQYIPFFEKELWRSLAVHANAKAREISSILEGISQVSIHYPVETNQIFFSVPRAWIPKIQKEIFCRVWDEEKNEIRFVTSWDTSDSDVKEVRRVLKEISCPCP